MSNKEEKLKARKGFTFYRSYYDIAMELGPMERAEFLTYILSIQFTGEPTPIKSKLVKLMVRAQSHAIHKQLEGYICGLDTPHNYQAVRELDKLPSEGNPKAPLHQDKDKDKEQDKEKEEVKEKEQKQTKPKMKKTSANDNSLLWTNLLVHGGAADEAVWAQEIDQVEPGALHHMRPLTDEQYTKLEAKYGRKAMTRVAMALINYSKRDQYVNLFALMNNWLPGEVEKMKRNGEDLGLRVIRPKDDWELFLERKKQGAA